MFFVLNVAHGESIDDKMAWQSRDKTIQESFYKDLELSSKPIQLPEIEPLPELPELSEKEVCFVIDVIEIEGLLSDWSKEQGQDYIGQCVGFESIQAYVRLINQKLLSEGYVTSRAVLPEQNIASHTLVIKIHEGTIEGITFPEDYRFFWEQSLPLKVGNVLNLRDMEQAVEQLNRLQSQDIKFNIEPGVYSNGSVLVAEVKPTKPWYFGMSTDNSGSASTGEYPVSLSGGVDNVLGIQDTLSYSLSGSREADTGESNSASVSWNAPIGYWLLGLSDSSSDYRQKTIGSVRDFELSGSSHDKKLSLDYVLLRDNKKKVSLFGAIKTRRRRSYIDGTEIEVQRRDLTEIELGSKYRQYLGRSVLDFSFSLHQGIELFGSDLVNSNAASDVAQPNYRFYSLSSSLSAPFSLFDVQMNYIGQFSAQYADTAIYSLDWFSNGGRYTVRGYSSSEALSSDSGWRLRNDVSLPLPFDVKWLSVVSYLGLDVGQVFGEGVEDDHDNNTLIGLSLGVKGALLGMNYDAFISEPFIVYGPYAEEHDYKVSVSVSAQF